MKVTRRSLLKGLVGAGALTSVSGTAKAREAQKPGPHDMGMLYDSTLCVGCRACETACKEANGLTPASQLDTKPSGDLDSDTKNVIKLCVGGDKPAYMKMQCMHCVDPACVSVCMAGGLHKIEEGPFEGVIAYDKTVCVGCRYCQVACPYDVPKFEWFSATPEIVKCELCRHLDTGPACCTACTSGAVIYGKLTDLLAEAHKRIEDHPDRYLDKVYGEVDGGGTHVLYLTDKDVSFEQLGLPKLPDHPLPQMSESVQHTIYKGFIAPAVLFGVLTGVQFFNRKKNAKAEAAAGEEGSS